MSNQKAVQTPTLNRMVEVKEQSQLCGDFFHWLQERYSIFEKARVRESPFEDVMSCGDYINVEKLLAEYFGIDLMEAEKEKEALLRQIINQ